MKSAQEPSKRIVSKGEYAWLQGKTLGVFIFSTGLLLAAVFFGLQTFALAAELFFYGSLWDFQDNGSSFSPF